MGSVYAKVVTTITSEIDLDTLKPEHSVNIEATPGIPEEVAKAVAVGAARSLLVALGESVTDPE